MQPDCLNDRIVYGTVYGDMHLKDLLGSIVRVGYRIPVPDFYLVLHDLKVRGPFVEKFSIEKDSYIDAI